MIPGFDFPLASYTHNMRLIGYSDQGGRSDGQQIMVHKGYAYIGHVFSQGFSIVDVRDPRNPKAAGYVPNPPNTRSLHLQLADGLLLLAQTHDRFATPNKVSDKDYYKNAAFNSTAHVTERDWSAGMAVYDISDPVKPRQIGFLPVEGVGIHRLWYIGGRWAYASALFDGFSDYILITIDMSDPTHPRVAGRFWLPGMNLAAGEMPSWPTEHGRYGLHHAIVDGDIAYCSWRDAGLVVVDVSDRSEPKLVKHVQWFPMIGGGTHNALPLPERDLLVVVDEAVLDQVEDGFRPIWVFDNKVKSAPRCISILPTPTDKDYFAVGGHFGPQNVHENRPGTFQSSEMIFATYQNAGVRVYDIRNPYQPVEIGACVPATPKKLIDPRPDRPVVLHTADVFVDQAGIVYCSDWSGAGFYIMEYRG